MLKKENKVYAKKNYDFKEEIVKTTWSDSVANKNFPLPNLELNLGDKDAILAEDMFTNVGLIGYANRIKTGPKPNCEAYIDFDLQLVTFIASKNIQKGEEIIYTLNPSCFNNVKIQ